MYVREEGPAKLNWNTKLRPFVSCKQICPTVCHVRADCPTATTWLIVMDTAVRLISIHFAWLITDVVDTVIGTHRQIVKNDGTVCWTMLRSPKSRNTINDNDRRSLDRSHHTKEEWWSTTLRTQSTNWNCVIQCSSQGLLIGNVRARRALKLCGNLNCRSVRVHHEINICLCMCGPVQSSKTENKHYVDVILLLLFCGIIGKQHKRK